MIRIGRTYHRKVALLFITAMLVLVALSSFITYWRFNGIMRMQTLKDWNQILLQTRVNIDNLVGSLDKATLLIYTDQTIMDILNKQPQEYIDTYVEVNRLNNELIKYMFVPLGSSLNAYTVSFFVTPDMPFSGALASGDQFFFGFFNGQDVRSSSWYKSAVEADGRLIWFNDPERPSHLYIARLIKNPEALDTTQRGRPSVIANVGVVVIGFNVSEFNKQLEASKLSPSTKLFITDAGGRPLYKNDAGADSFPLEDYVSLESGTVVRSGTDYVMNRYPLAFGWQLIGLIPLNEISEGASVVRLIVGSAALVAIAAGLLLSFFISKQISAPIRKLAGTMKTIMNADHLNIYLEPPKGKDEIGILYRSFNGMMERIQTLLREVYESGIRAKESEMKALQAQINPHFLYNTLDSVNWIALESGVDRISEINSSLVNMYRYIAKDAHETVTVAEELQQVQHYINIQSLCYPDLFEFEVEIPDELNNIRCPKLIFQPLVENAILHGVEKSKRKGRIRITAHKERGTAVFAIADNGAGADTDELNAFLEGRGHSLPVSLGSGIRNVHRRIQLKFGEAYGLRYRANEGGGIVAEVRMPISGRTE
jgi:two-component system sensor histidine kinase YesM